MDEHVIGLAAGPLRGLVQYTGYRQEGLPPGVHRGLPSPYLTMIVTLDEPVTVQMGRSPSTYATLVGGLHATPALITHGGAQSGIQISLDPLASRALLLQSRVAAGAAGNLAGVAAAAGYFDQAHLDRDFRAFAGCSPTGWLHAEFRNVQAFAPPAVEDEEHDYDIRAGTGAAGLAGPGRHRRP